jgi:hypothetical protein
MICVIQKGEEVRDMRRKRMIVGEEDVCGRRGLWDR